MKIGTIGMGFVGETTAEVLGKTHEILPYDKYKPKYQDPSKLREAELVFISVPTPMKPSGEIDYSAIHDSLETLVGVVGDKSEKPLVVLRSTAVPGTTDRLESDYPFNFVFTPEFLRERCALEDMLNLDRVVIGANREEDYEMVAAVYKSLFPDAEYLHVDARTAEMIKYSSNVMLLGQIALANEIYQICTSLSVDYDIIKNALLMDRRIARNIDVPGPDGDLGFGGKCFPKDLNALIYLAREYGYNPHLLEEIWRSNNEWRKNKDWLNIPGATSGNQDFEQKSKE
jgi:UDPglucose 6-dehydrogenase